MRRFLIAAAIAASAAATMLVAPAAEAGEALAPATARQLDGQPLEFSASAARRERMMIIQENMARQRYYQNRGYGRGPGYGYGRGGGYGRGYGYGRGPGYGPGPVYPGESPWGRAVRRGW
ncbi:hypothetical protein ACXIUS_00365 [Bosea thiooxidans]|nr:hypothetical protein [Bosea sp. (in: a-proteobacteria)]